MRADCFLFGCRARQVGAVEDLGTFVFVARGSLGAMLSAAPDAEIAAIMEDKTLSFVERMRRRQDLMNTRFLAAQHEEGKPEDKVRTARTFQIESQSSVACASGEVHILSLIHI